MKIMCAECSKLLFEHSNDDCSAVFKAKQLGYIFKNPILFTGKSESLYFCNEAHKNQYFAKNVGLVRRDLIDSNEVWNLVNYHIQQ